MPTVLIVDDEPSVLRTLKRLFNRRGFEVRCASSPAQAILPKPWDEEKPLRACQRSKG
jgi:ActR/RegA family two-component response regulator